MNFLQNILQIATNILKGFVPVMSRELREQLQNVLRTFRENARKTSNPLDDVVAGLLCDIMDVK